MTGAELLWLTVLGAVLALDGASLGQFMVSRPMVAGLLAGLVVGAPGEGFALGALLEIYLLVSLPVGGARSPEGAPATVIAVGTALTVGTAGGVAVGVATGLVWGQLGAMSTTFLRSVNARLAPDPALGRIAPSRPVRGLVAAVALDALRAAALTASGLLVGAVAVSWGAAHWPLDAGRTEAALLLGGFVSLGALLQSFGGARRRGGLVAVGLLLGVAGALVL